MSTRARNKPAPRSVAARPVPAAPPGRLARLGPGARLAIAFTLYLLLRLYVLGTIPPIHFSDTPSYVEQYRHGFGEGFFGRVRTWGYPLAIWFLGHNLTLLVIVQRLAAVLAWFGLAVASASMFRSVAARRVAFWGTLLISLAMHSVVWDAMLLTESFSNSLFIALTAALVWFLGSQGAGLRPLGLMAALAVPFAGLRDSNLFPLYLLLACLVPALALRFLRGPAPRPPRRHFWIGAALVAFIVLVCFVHSWDMKACRRNWQSVGATLSMRVYVNYVLDEEGKYTTIPAEAHIDWLVKHYGLRPQDAYERMLKTVYAAPPLNPVYENWLKETGPRALIGFMVHHLDWVFGTFSFYPVYELNNAEMYLKPPESWARARLGLPNDIQYILRQTLTRVLGILWINIPFMVAVVVLGLGWLARSWMRGLDGPARHLGVLFWLITMNMMIAFIAIFGDFYEPWRHSILGLLALYAAVPLLIALVVDYCSKFFR